MTLTRFLLCCLSLALAATGCSRGPIPAAEIKTLVIGMDATYPPFEFVGKDGKFAGVSVAIGEQIAKTLGKPVEFRNMNFDGLIPALQSGQIDLIISSVTASDERRKSIDFSDPYVKTGICLLLSKDSPVTTAEELKAEGRKLVVRIATTGEQWCKQEYTKAKVVALDSDAACVLEVVNGTVDAWVYDQVSIMNYHNKHPDRTRALLAPLREESWAVGVKQGRADLRGVVNAALATMKKEGAFEKLADQYLAKERDMMKAQGLPFVF